ncbi:hypothetical protein HOC80_00185 [archaeon]|jgi:hypothetical protein|nr:hypothetical protein [archaeon]MBT4416502.1 hypothetical protein [archaeon]
MVQKTETPMKTVFLYIDAMCFHYTEHMPFLNNLSKRSVTSNIQVEPLHQFEFSIFASQHQKDLDMWAWFYRNPEKSHFKWLKPFAPIIKKIKSNKFRELITYSSALLAYFRGETRFVKLLGMDIEKALQFAPMAQRAFIDQYPAKIKTLFDILREKNIQYTAYEWPLKTTNKTKGLNPFYRSDKAISNFIIKNIKNNQFVFAHTVELDSKMHALGVNHPKVIQHLKQIDNNIKNIYNELKKYNYNFIIASDHGMVPITDTLDITKLLDKEYSFSDSTCIRIWTKDIKGTLNKIKTNKGKVFTKETMKNIPLTYNRDYTGDILFVANPGVNISPNDLDGKNIPKAMHGYLPTDKLDAFFLIKSSNPIKKTETKMGLVDICPTILNSLNIKQPKEWKGKSIIQIHK